MLKKAQVIALPTDKASHLYIGLSTDRWNYSHKGVETGRLNTSYYLYFTTDEEIKDGDWIVQTNYEKTFSNVVRYTYYGKGSFSFRKIVATTNTDLWENPKMIKRKDGCPFYLKNGYYQAQDEHGIEILDKSEIPTPISKIGLDFVEAFVKASGAITEVNLEYDTFPISANGNVIGTKQSYPYTGLAINFDFTIKEVLKLRSNGTVIIHPIKEKTYSRKELMQACRDFRAEMGWGEFGEDGFCTKSDAEKWFDKRFPE